VRPYILFEELQGLLAEEITHHSPDVIIHCAAVSDYRAAGVYAPQSGTWFHAESGRWEGVHGGPPTLADRAAGKVKSDEPELWLRLVRTPKLVDLIRSEWGFRGVLVKFKLEVGVSDEELLAIAERSSRQSAADLMVANTLEGAQAWAFLGPIAGQYERVERSNLARRLLEEVERLHEERTRG
jgi:phosphopantothenoylcysteine synthetase/decarboxylase